MEKAKEIMNMDKEIRNMISLSSLESDEKRAYLWEWNNYGCPDEVTEKEYFLLEEDYSDIKKCYNRLKKELSK